MAEGSAVTETRDDESRYVSIEHVTAKLYIKLLAASRAISAVEKRGRNKQQNYEYVRAEDVFQAAYAALRDHDLLVDFEVLSVEQQSIKSGKGGDGMVVTVHGKLTVTDPSTGASITRHAVGSGADYPGDKGTAKAATAARKYALIHLLGIPIGEDPDEDRKQADTKPARVSAAIAKKLVDRAWKVDGARERLQLAASHVAERDVGSCDTKAKATKAIAGLNFDEAERLSKWVSEKDGEAEASGE